MPTQELQALPRSYATATGQLNSRPPVLLSGVTALSYVMATAEMSGRLCPLEARPISHVEAVATMSGRVAPLSAYPKSHVVATASLSGKATPLSARPFSYALASASMGGKASLLSARPFSYVRTSAVLTGGSDSHGMSICDVLDELLSMWGIFSRCSAPEVAIDRALNDINASLQTVWNHADERNYWSNETLTITLADGASSQDLPDNIQNVVGPCRRADNRRPLALIGTIGELETFSDIYLDGETAGEPVAYHIERMNQVGNDPAKCVFHVTPAVEGDSVGFLLEVVKQAPRFLTNDLRACPIIPIPHRYVESLLLPIARYQASSFYLFRKADQKETIDREYQQARIALGLADPLPGKSGDNLERREAKS